jgi:hypothetical protein
MEAEIDETFAAEPFLRRYELLKTDASALARLEREGRAAYANVHDPAWWDQATPAQFIAAWDAATVLGHDPAAAAALQELRAGIYHRIDLLEWVCRSNPDTLAVQEFAPTQGLAPGSYDIRDLTAEAVKAVDATTQADPKRVLVEVYAKPDPTPVPTATFSCRRSMGPQRICDSIHFVLNADPSARPEALAWTAALPPIGPDSRIVIEDHAYRLIVYPAGWAVDDDLVGWMDTYLAANPPPGLGDTAGIGGLFAGDTSPSSRSPVTERLPLRENYRDKLTGFEGFAVARYSDRADNVKVCLTRARADGKPEDAWFDENRLERLEGGTPPQPSPRAGSPQHLTHLVGADFPGGPSPRRSPPPRATTTHRPPFEMPCFRGIARDEGLGR